MSTMSTMSRMAKGLACLTLAATIMPVSATLPEVSASSTGGGPTIIYVDAAATGAANGTSWADAYTGLQGPLSAASSGSEIWVAEGTYQPGAARSSTFQLKNGVELYGGFPQGGAGGAMGARDPWRYTTILSGEIGDPGAQADNCYHVLAGTGTDSTAVLDGFQVTAGYANGLGSLRGGGMINNFGSPTIRNTLFLRNYAEAVGGAIENLTSSPAMENVVFLGNRAGGGGAVHNADQSHPDISNAIFVGNTAVWGGAVSNEISSSPVLRNITMVSNEATSGGGGVFVDGTSGAAVMNSILWGNAPHQILVNRSPSGTASVYHSIVQGGCPVDVACDSVIADDPLFVRSPSPGIAVQAGPPPPSWGDEDDHYGDLRLESGSPAIDSGNNAMLKPGVVTDLMGNPRLVDGPEEAITAMGGGGFTIDRGAYEAPPMPIYVDQSAAGANTGYTWTNAFHDLQAAFLWGRSGVAEIWVAEGTYLPGDLRTSTFQLLGGMAVYGGFPPGGGDGTFGARDGRSYRTYLSGDIGVPLEPTDNVYHVVTASDVAAPVLDTVLIGYGHADGDGYTQGLGGGIYAPNAHPRLHRVVVQGCYAERGGGGAYFKDSEAKLSETEFYANASGREGGGLLLVNGGMFVIEDGYFQANAATGRGGGLCSAGGHLTLYDTYFESNQAVQGGGLYLGDVSARLDGARFVANTADDAGGGLLVEMEADVTVTDSLFSNNSAAGDGGALAVYDSELILRNVTLSGNHADGDGGGADVGFLRSSVFHNTILWGNAAAGSGDQVHLGDPGDLSLNHSLVEDGCPVGAVCNDTVTDDPLFYADPDPGDDGTWGTFDDERGDLRLWKVSPAIDAGDTYAVGFDRWDVAGNPRLVDVASVADTGEGPGSVPVVDIGAYESPADVIHVDRTAAGGYSGLTWTDAFTDVQDALSWGSSGPADVWIAQGTYAPGTERRDSFHLVNGVSLYGGFPTGGGDGTFGVRDWRAYTTTLSGEIGAPNDRGDNSYHVLVGRDVDRTVRVDGFVVTRGSADIVPHVSPVRVSCTMGDTDYGGGLCLHRSEPILANLTFRDNYAWRGGGAELSYSRPLMANVAFVANEAGTEGGALHSDASELTLINGLFVGNRAVDAGGAMWSDASSLTLLNATLGGNHAGTGGALTNASGTGVALTNTILWANSADAGPPVSSDVDCTLEANYSLLDGGCPAGAACTHVLSGDPAFVRDPDPGADGIWGTVDDVLGDLQLQITSPAIDAGDSDAFPGSITTDLIGNPRLVDISVVPNTGTGTVPIDMGAYEYANTPPVAADDGYTTAQDTPLTVDAPGVLENDTDPEGDPLTAVKESEPVSGTLVLKANGFLLYTPDPDASGPVTFTYHAEDGTASSNVATVTITVTAVNDPPTISDIPDQVTSPGTPVGPLSFVVGDAETPAEALILSAESSDTELVPVGHIHLGGTGANRTLTITPAMGRTGETTITITVDDGTDTASNSLVLTVEPLCTYLPLVIRQ